MRLDIEHEFMQFCDAIYGTDISDHNRNELRNTFFAGMLIGCRAVAGAATAEDTTAAIAQIFGELEQFNAKVLTCELMACIVRGGR